MPYADRSALPASLRRRLPPHAQEIYVQAFNHALITYRRRPDRDQVAHRVAWAAVKRVYVRTPEAWVAKHASARDTSHGG